MPTCWAMVPKTSPLLRGFAELLTFTDLVISSFETGRAVAFFTTLVAILNSSSSSREYRRHPIGCGSEKGKRQLPTQPGKTGASGACTIASSARDAPPRQPGAG